MLALHARPIFKLLARLLPGIVLHSVQLLLLILLCFSIFVVVFFNQLVQLTTDNGQLTWTVFNSGIQERKEPVVSRQCVVYQFKCDLCDTDYTGYTTRRLHQRIEEHRATAVGAHVKGCHGISNPELLKQFSVLKKCQEKLDCLIREMLFIREKKPKLNTQSDSIHEHFNAHAQIRWLMI